VISHCKSLSVECSGSEYMTAENSQAVDSVAADADVILNISHNMETDDSTVAEPDVPSNRPDDSTAAEAAVPSNRIWRRLQRIVGLKNKPHRRADGMRRHRRQLLSEM